MNKPIILANENLVLNGDFEQWIDHWIQEPASGYLGTASDWYEEEGQHVRFLTAGNGASVNQALTAPKDPRSSSLCPHVPVRDEAHRTGQAAH